MPVNEMRNYYRVLQVAEDADYQTIDDAYWRLARESWARPDGAQYTLGDLNEAHGLLRTPLLRQRYDASRRRQTTGDGASLRPGSNAEPRPAPAAPGERADALTVTPATEPQFVDLLQIQVRQVRERIRARNASLEAGDPHAESPLQRMFGRLRES